MVLVLPETARVDVLVWRRASLVTPFTEGTVVPDVRLPLPVADSRTLVEDVRSVVLRALRLFRDFLIFSTSAATETFLASEDEERSANLTPTPMRIESELLLVLLPYESATFPEWL